MIIIIKNKICIFEEIMNTVSIVWSLIHALFEYIQQCYRQIHTSMLKLVYTYSEHLFCKTKWWHWFCVIYPSYFCRNIQFLLLGNNKFYMIHDSCIIWIYTNTMMVPTNAHKYSEISSFTQDRCVNKQIALYVCAFVGTIIVYLSIVV
jgi:hypothetical protein